MSVIQLEKIKSIKPSMYHSVYSIEKIEKIIFIPLQYNDRLVV